MTGLVWAVRIDVDAKGFLAYFHKRRVEMKNWQSQERDARWYRLNKSGKTQAEIAEEYETTQSYVCQRIKAHRERHVNEKNKDKFELAAAMKVKVTGMLSNIEKPSLNPHGDFVDEAFQRYAEFRSKFNDMQLRK